MTTAGVMAAAGCLGAAVAIRAVSAAPVPRARVDDRAVPAAYADGAPPGFSGGFGEQTCHACHFHDEPNAPPGRLALTGVPETFDPGARYTLTITLTRPGMAAGGFQLTARAEKDGAQAGTLEPGPADAARVKVERPDAVAYAGQRRAGSRPVADETIAWTVVWTAPTSAGPVVFHLAANAADNDESASGDFVYTAVLRSTLRQTGDRR